MNRSSAYKETQTPFGDITGRLYPGDYGYENAPVTTRYHSQTDLYYHKIMGLDSYVINRYDYSFSLAGNDPTCDKDVFLRFFLFLNY